MLLAALWLLWRSPAFPNISRPSYLQPLGDVVLLALGAIMLAAVILANARQMRRAAREREQDHEALLRQKSYVNALAHTARQVNLDRRLPVVLQSICGEAAIALGMDGAIIALCDAGQRTLEPAASFGLLGELARSFKTVSYAGTDIRAGSRNEMSILPAGCPEPVARLYSELHDAGNFRSIVHLPLLDGQETLGIFDLLARLELTGLTPEQTAAFRSFAAQAAVAIRNDRLLADSRDIRSKLDTLHLGDLAILSSLDLVTTLRVFLRQVVEHLGVDAADVLLLNPASQLLEYAAGTGFQTGKLETSRVALGTGFSGRIALERKSLFVADVNDAKPFTRRELILGEGVVTYYGMPLVARDRVLGVLEAFHRRSFQPDRDWTAFLETLAGQAAIAIDNATLYSDLQKANQQLSVAYDRTLEGWSRALDLRDRETEGHTQRVTDLCLRLAQALDVQQTDLVHMRRGALLHDIGKMGIPDQVLLKPGEFDADDQRIMQAHPALALEMLSPITFLEPAMDIPYAHHERWDGSGYPQGLRGEAIPLAARIFAVVDVWDAMTSDRPYRKALSEQDALQFLRQGAGHQFDPRVVDVFLKLMTGAAPGVNPAEADPARGEAETV